MDKDIAIIISIIGAISGISGILLGWIGKARMTKQETRDDASKDATLRTDMEYIKRGIDDVRVEQRLQGQRFDTLSERVTRVEESAKSAHHRIDRVEANR